ncbi:Phage tail assembly chaperone protein [uncultured Caudovirales phage]|uniref:Phage tail assembly chaperone protein n=1 Tax=uncultured Caudovirales phage TaxID=2100421 RepID=A0A6J7XKH0_9CAUD|nr:Phage tail assembly chaperone protein [uncultured Caudovirales phage]
MKSYAIISDDGFVVSTSYSEIPQDGMVEIFEPIGNAPSEWHKYHFESKQWVKDKPIEATETEIKTERKKLLTDSDWTQIPNGPLTSSQQAAWATYRQELRDITQQSGYPLNVIWPTIPT